MAATAEDAVAADSLAQPGGGAHPWRHLLDRLGERLPSALGVLAAPTPLAPHQLDRIRPVGQILGAGGDPGLGRARARPAARAARRARVVGDHVHHPRRVLTAGAGLDTPDRHSSQTQQLRRTVLHGPWPPPAAPKHSENQAATGPHHGDAPNEGCRANEGLARSRSKTDYGRVYSVQTQERSCTRSIWQGPRRWRRSCPESRSPMGRELPDGRARYPAQCGYGAVEGIQQYPVAGRARSDRPCRVETGAEQVIGGDGVPAPTAAAAAGPVPGLQRTSRLRIRCEAPGRLTSRAVCSQAAVATAAAAPAVCGPIAAGAGARVTNSERTLPETRSLTWRTSAASAGRVQRGWSLKRPRPTARCTPKGTPPVGGRFACQDPTSAPHRAPLTP